ncbi:MAG: hypothetical protein ABW040_07910 [Microbacteriaceae bacterium]
MTAIDRRDRAFDARLPGFVSSIGATIARHRASLLWLTPTLLLGAIVSFVNLGGSPQRIDDEGTYTAQAWSIFNLGELTHYTYWYDHPPLGWMQIAGYTQLTGAFERHALAVLAGREAVVVATLIAAALLFALARKLELSRPTAAVATLVFLLSPLAVQFHRTVYLDNIATAWLIGAFVLALSRKHQLAGYAGASFAFAIAVLTKETYLLALPFLIWVMIRSSQRATRRYTFAISATLLVLLGGAYLLFAAVKGELIPGTGRVSLIDGVMFQLSSRDGSGSPFDPESLMSATLGMWWQLDPVLIVAGLVAAIAAVGIRSMRPFAVMVLALTAFMFRPGGYLPVPYVIILIPFAALLIAAVGERAIRALKVPGRARVAGVGGVLALAVAGAALAPLWFVQLRGLLLADLDQPMRQAQSWVAANVPEDSRLIVDDAMWVDLVEQGRDRENVVWYYKVDTDPEVQAQSPNGWQDADYVITTDSMRTFPDGFPQVREAIDNSVVVASFGESNQAVEVRRVVATGLESAETGMAEAVERAAALGTQIVQNPNFSAPASDEDLLTGGQVDPRVILGLASHLPDSSISVAGFPLVDGEGQLPRRQVLVTEVGGEPVVSGGELTAAGLSLVGSASGPFSPSSTAVVGDALKLTYSFQLAMPA